MEEPPRLIYEEARLAALRRLELLDTPAEERFDRITRLTARLFGTPIALVTLLDADRQWFKSRVGMHPSEIARSISFCGHAIATHDALVVSDAALDERFADNPLVVGDPHIRFYAGQALVDANGHALGTLCVVDRVPRTFSAEDLLLLSDLAAMVEQELGNVALNRTVSALQDSEARWSSTFDAGPIAMAILDLGVGSQLPVREVNRALCELTGYDRHQLERMELLDLFEPDDEGVRGFEDVTIDELRRGALPRQIGECRLLRRDGSRWWVRLHVALVSDGDGRPLRFAVHLGDLEDRKRAEAELAHLATHDVLTDLPNRALLVDRIGHELGRIPRQPGHLGVFYLDCDGFKPINDRWGHHAGDRYLVEVADRLRSAIRAPDTAARIGGDEFVVVCPGLSGEAELAEIGSRLQATLAAPFALADGTTVAASFSAGMTLAGPGDGDAWDVLRRADAAMYRAKRKGPGRVAEASSAS